MNTVTIDANTPNKTALLKSPDQYIIITADIRLLTDLVIGANSTLDFRGGSFIGTTDQSGTPATTITLNNNQVIAGAYCIFKKLTVKKKGAVGFANNEVRAEWFNDSSSAGGDEVFINKAIIAADEHPVILECRTYNLSGSITFIPGISGLQTLICPGTLKVNCKKPAIDVNTKSVNLQINKIIGSARTTEDTDDEDLYQGEGIQISTYCEHSNFEVNTMYHLNKGFSILPVSEREDNKDSETQKEQNENKIKTFAGAQYCRFKFGIITADYCFYIDTWEKGFLTQTNNNTYRLSNWFSQSYIIGNEMKGRYGIYMAGPEEHKDNPEYSDKDLSKISTKFNGLVFDCISFSGITKLAIRLRRLEMCRFLNLQMFNNMPGMSASDKDDTAPWIDLANVSGLEFTFNTFIMATHIQVGDDCTNCIMRGQVADSPTNFSVHFDTLGIDTIRDETNGNTTQMFVTNSVTPYNMAIDVTANSDTAGDDKTLTKYVKDLLPELKTNSSDNYNYGLPVLPSAVNANISNGHTLVLDLSGLSLFAPCLYTVNAKLGTGSTLKFQTSDYTVIQGGSYIPSDSPSIPGKCVKSFTTGGVYRIMWLKDWSLEIQKIADI